MTKKRFNFYYHESTNKISHLVYHGYYLCNKAVGKIKPNHIASDRWCINCEKICRKKGEIY